MFLHDTATTEIYTYSHTLSRHDALPISEMPLRRLPRAVVAGIFVHEDDRRSLAHLLEIQLHPVVCGDVRHGAILRAFIEGSVEQPGQPEGNAGKRDQQAEHHENRRHERDDPDHHVVQRPAASDALDDLEVDADRWRDRLNTDEQTCEHQT